jgi:zinc finger protein
MKDSIVTFLIINHRDCLKADSAMVMLPELDLELSHGTLGGLYTTVEGLLNKILVQLTASNPFSMGDSTHLHHSASGAPSETRAKFEEFLSTLESFTRGLKMPFTLILRDPLGNSFVSAPLGSFLPPEADENLTLEEFERSYEENDEFGTDARNRPELSNLQC